MDIVLTLSVLGSVASIIGLLLPAKDWKTRGVHVTYGLIVVVLSYSLISSQSDTEKYKLELDRIRDIERSARKLSENSNQYSYIGYAQATLAFLEKHKELYPETYERAKLLCEKSDCYSTSQDLEHKYGLIDLRSAYSGLLKGVTVLSSEDS